MKFRHSPIAASIALAFAMAWSVPQHAEQAAPQPAAGPPAAPGARAGGGFGRGAQPFDYSDNDGWQPLFDGQTLNGWAGDTRYWSVKDGSIFVEPSCEKPTGTIYLVWQGGEVADFMLKFESKGTGSVNGGVQYRSYLTADQTVALRYPSRGGRPGGPGPAAGGAAGGAGRGAVRGGGAPGGGGRGPQCANPGTEPTAEEKATYNMNGPQFDFDAGNRYPGQYYEQGGRGIVASPGQAVIAEPGQPNRVLATIADKATLDSWFKKDDYNQFLLIAKGHTHSMFMNGHLVSVFIDNDPAYFRSSGKIGLEVESTGGYYTRNIDLKRLF